MNLNFTIVLQILSFLVLLGLLTKFLYGPLCKYLDERADNIRKLTEGAERDRKEAESHFETSRKELRGAKEEAVRLIESAIHEADKEKIKTIDGAKKEAFAIMERAELGIKKEIEKAKDDVKKDIASLSVEIAKKILGREINEKDHEKLIRESLKSINRAG